VTTKPSDAQPLSSRPRRTEGLTISDLARRTGLTPATLRTWESRHGFPRPKRLDSGHRRYDEHDVTLVQQVLRRRDAGVRLEVAIGEAAAAEDTPAASVFAVLRRRHPQLQPQTLRKATLLALSWAMEDECCARAQRPLLFGAFQRARFFAHSAKRWAELARTAEQTTVFADLDDGDVTQVAGVRMVDLPREAPLRREWVLVCDAADYPACLAAWELPGQDGVPDHERLFEALWTLEPLAVRDAARSCAQLADRLDPARAGTHAEALAGTPGEASADLRQATSLFARLVAYVDSLASR
jgi:MerR family transcriptional regulator, light-induced transcriptional regulator